MKNPKAKEPTNFDLYLEEHLKEPEFAERFRRAGEAWDVALRIAAPAEESGHSQADRQKD